MRPYDRLLWGGLFVLVSVGAWGVGPQVAADGTSDPSFQRDFQFSFKVVTPEIRLGRYSDSDDALVVEIEGFETRERRHGAPDVPTKTVLVAIPPDARPWLEIKGEGRERFLRDRLPRPVPREEVVLSEADTRDLQAKLPEARRIEILSRAKRERFDRDPAIYAAAERYPRESAWLGRIGVVRDQRYVEVHVAGALRVGLS